MWREKKILMTDHFMNYESSIIDLIQVNGSSSKAQRKHSVDTLVGKVNSEPQGWQSEGALRRGTVHSPGMSSHLYQ